MLRSAPLQAPAEPPNSSSPSPSSSATSLEPPTPLLASRAPSARHPHLGGLEARVAEPLGALALLQVKHVPMEGLRVTGLLGQGSLGRMYTVRSSS